MTYNDAARVVRDDRDFQRSLDLIARLAHQAGYDIPTDQQVIVEMFESAMVAAFLMGRTHGLMEILRQEVPN